MSKLTLTLGLLSSVVTLFSFAAILWRLSGTVDLPVGSSHVAIPGYMLWAALAYAVVGTWLTHRIGRPLIDLNFKRQQFEAHFRFSLARLRENTEAVALYRGEREETRSLSERFRSIVVNWWSIMRRQKRLTWFTAGYNQAAVVFPVLAAAPRYFAGTIQLGALMQTIYAFGQVQSPCPGSSLRTPSSRNGRRPPTGSRASGRPFAPPRLFLDEATASLDEDGEQRLYQLLAQRLPHATIVSVGHRSALAAFHPHRLRLQAADDDGLAARERAFREPVA